MRRSAAPSRKFISPVAGITQPQTVNEKLNIKSQPFLPIKSDSVRSTSSILNILKKNTTVPTTQNTPNLQSTVSEQENIPQNTSNKRVFNVVWGKKSTKKHKTWEGDGILEVGQCSAILKDTDGKEMGRATKIKPELFEEGYILSVAGKEVQLIDLLPNGAPVVTSTKRYCTDDEQNSLKTFKKPKYKTPTVGTLCLNKVTKRKGTFTLDYQPLVLPQPPSEHQWVHNTNKKPIVDVSVDSCLAKVLRPHQRCGVVFLYECVMGFKQTECYGAILADEMGLGKTLQCITLVWTLLKQGPYGGCPIVRRVLVVTPSSLTGNWEKEFMGWLGRERIRTFVVDTKNKPKDYAKTPHIPILIISYEMFVRCVDELNKLSFDLMICDEGHRLKNNSIKVSNLLNQLDCKRRIILTGTPIQNDLQEFYALTDFVNPGFLGSNTEYRKYFEEPIIASREPDVDDEIKDLGAERATELNRKTSHFILRRTQDLLDKYLPTKTEIVVFCRSSELQQKLYEIAIDCWENREVASKEIAHLSVITALKKICNHPSLVQLAKEPDEQCEESLTSRLCEALPSWDEMTPDDSGKLKVLLELLKNLSSSKEKIVVVSSYTQTLDMLADICDHNNYKYCRLDGSVPSNQRTKIVEKFNNKWSDDLVFLLSAKAGGVGLNLVGASRLVLFDSDWNPATDLQAMSRVWRDGQKKSVYLYRFLTAGTIEEKIYQRQISKTGLSGTIVDPNNQSSIRMSDEELKDLFSLQFDADCSTHLLLNCECTCDGTIPEPKELTNEMNPEQARSCQLGVPKTSDASQSLRMNQLMQWEHHGQPFNESVLKEIKLSEVASDISFIFRNQCSL